MPTELHNYPHASVDKIIHVMDVLSQKWGDMRSDSDFIIDTLRNISMKKTEQQNKTIVNLQINPKRLHANYLFTTYTV